MDPDYMITDQMPANEPCTSKMYLLKTNANPRFLMNFYCIPSSKSPDSIRMIV